MIRYTAISAVPSLTLQLWVLTVLYIVMLIVPHNNILFLSGLCHEGASRCDAAAPEEVWVGLQLHDIRQKRMHHRRPPQPADTDSGKCSLAVFYDVSCILGPKVSLLCLSESDLWTVRSRGPFGRPEEWSLHCSHKRWRGMVPVWRWQSYAGESKLQFGLVGY